MSIIKTCYENIGDYTSIDTLYNLCRRHKQGSIDRKCRELTEGGKIMPVKEKGAIIAYQKVYNTILPKQPYRASTGQTKANKAMLDADQQLQELLKSIKPNWNNLDKINKIKIAIKSNNTFYKNNFLKQWKKQT